MARKHVHKYHNIQVAYNKVWACALPDCTHYMPKHMEEMVPGKKSICWQCNEPFILDTEAMKEDKPRCIGCRSGISSEATNYLETLANRD